MAGACNSSTQSANHQSNRPACHQQVRANAQKADAAGGYSESEYVASFGGFATASDPRLVCLVVINSPQGKEHQGGQVAAPVFSRIMTDALRHLRIAPDAAPLRAGRRVMRASTEGRAR